MGGVIRQPGRSGVLNTAEGRQSIFINGVPVSQLYKTIFGRQLDQRFTLMGAIRLLESKNLIDAGELAEQAISKKSKIERCAKNFPEIDLVSGKQIKHARTNPDRTNSSGTMMATVSIKNHRSTILAVVTERKSNMEYYFAFPYSAYRHLNGNTLNIPFYNDGKAYSKNKWWRYQVSSFTKLCEMAR